MPRIESLIGGVYQDNALEINTLQAARLNR